MSKRQAPTRICFAGMLLLTLLLTKSMAVKQIVKQAVKKAAPHLTPGAVDTTSDGECNYTCDCSDECDCIPQPEYLDPPICPASNKTLDDGVKVAWKFAPVLHQHPLEWSHLSDPVEWMRKASLFDPVTKDVTSFQEMGLTKENWTEWNVVLPRTWMSLLSNNDSTGVKENAGELMRGSPFEDGKSTARVFFTAFEEDDYRVTKEHNAWVFTYHHFYPFNGCSNQFLSLIENNQYASARYYMCPTGVHEGDWERVTVYVCKENEQIRRVQYSQHNWITEYDCPDGKCPYTETVKHTEPGTDNQEIEHPVTYSALFSHANYPYASDLWIYQSVRVDYLANMDAFYVIDRTRKDPGKVFIPTPENIVYLPRAELMDTSDNDQVWGLYTGSFGGHVTATKRSVTCMDSNFSEQRACESGTLVGEILRQILGDYDYASQLKWTVKVQENKTETIGGITGPLNRDYAYIYNVPRQAPLWDFYTSPKQIQCPFHRFDLEEIQTKPMEFRSVDVSRFIWGMVLGVVLGGVMLVIVLLAPILATRSRPEKGYVLLQDGEVSAKVRVTDVNEPATVTMQHRSINLIVYWMFFAVCLYIAGVVVISIGVNDLFDALQKVKYLGIWDDIRSALITLLVLMGFFDLVIIVISLFVNTSQQVMFCGVRVPCSSCAGKCAWQLHAVCAGVCGIVINVSLLIFGFGFLVWVGRLVLSKGCHVMFKVINELEVGNVCLDLTNVGLEMYCGEQLAAFCNEWNELRVGLISWGSFPLLLSHLMIMIVAIVDYCDARSQAVEVDIQSGEAQHHPAYLSPLVQSQQEDEDPNIFDPQAKVSTNK